MGLVYSASGEVVVMQLNTHKMLIIVHTVNRKGRFQATKCMPSRGDWEHTTKTKICICISFEDDSEV